MVVLHTGFMTDVLTLDSRIIIYAVHLFLLAYNICKLNDFWDKSWLLRYIKKLFQ